MRSKIIFFEVRGGNDKGQDGYRPDTMPMVHALHQRGLDAEVIFFEAEQSESIYTYVQEHAIAYVSRINPGNLKDEATYFSMLRKLCENGVIGMPHPDAMINYGSKDALIKLRSTSLVPDDTYAYYSMEEFKENFPFTIATGERVLKQNRGSAGEGIWRVQLVDAPAEEGTRAALTSRVQCTEAKDHHTDMYTVEQFMEFCEQYIEGENGMIVDMPFLPRIEEGEIRLLLLRHEPVAVVHKKPANVENAFSATLFSGAEYRYEDPDKWPQLVQHFNEQLPVVTSLLGAFDIPLIWTADFILDTDSLGKDRYILGEMNCSCVGFTSHLSLADAVAEAIMETIQERVEIIA